MKIALFAFLISLNSFAHQYIQCHNDSSQAWNIIVISLDAERKNGTLYLHEDFGNQTNTSRPFAIKVDRITADITTFKGYTQRGVHHASIPTAYVGVPFKQKIIRLRSDIEGREFWIEEDYICFSNIYNEDK